MSGPWGTGWVPPAQRRPDGQAERVERIRAHLIAAHGYTADRLDDDLDRLHYRHATVHARGYPFIGAAT